MWFTLHHCKFLQKTEWRTDIEERGHEANGRSGERSGRYEGKVDLDIGMKENRKGVGTAEEGAD